MSKNVVSCIFFAFFLKNVLSQVFLKILNVFLGEFWSQIFKNVVSQVFLEDFEHVFR